YLGPLRATGSATDRPDIYSALLRTAASVGRADRSLSRRVSRPSSGGIDLPNPGIRRRSLCATECQYVSSGAGANRRYSTLGSQRQGVDGFSISVVKS